MPLGHVGGDLPLPLGVGGAVGAPPTDVDVLVDRLPFWLSIDPQAPYQRETAQYAKDQVDQTGEAGEQSLAGWWTRSQMSFHNGAGLDYLDTTARPEEADRLRYKTSRNVDVWTPGVAKRLNETQLLRSAAVGERVWVEPLETGLVKATDSLVEVYDGASWTALNYGSTAPIRAFCTDGESYYAATDAGIYKGSLAGGTGALVFTLPGTTVPMCLGWVKQRLVLGHGNKVYSLDVAGPALPSPKHTHPTGSWRWTSFSDSPTGILASGYAGLQAGMFRFELQELETAPVLGPGIAALSMPSGERILSTLYYLGGVLVLGTNRGVRVCPFDAYSGALNLGPLSVETEAPVTALGAYDRFVWAGSRHDGEPACVRVDLSARLTEAGHYAWAPDLPMLGEVSSFAFREDGRKWIGVAGFGLVEELAMPATGEAFLETARIRFATAEDKHFMYGTVRGSLGAVSPVRVHVATNTSDWKLAATATTTSRWRLRAPRGEWVSFRLYLDGTAELSSYQVQALPAGKRQRLIQFPLALTDYQLTRSGIEAGYPGWALDRMTALETLEEAGAEVTITAPALFPESVRCVIERVTFIQAYDPGDRGEGTGGRLRLVVRTTT